MSVIIRRRGRPVKSDRRTDRVDMMRVFHITGDVSTSLSVERVHQPRPHRLMLLSPATANVMANLM